MCMAVYDVGDGGASVSPKPRRSGAMQRYPMEERERSWWRQEYQSSGNPWRKSTGGPVPIEATCMFMPFVGTVVCSMFSIVDTLCFLFFFFFFFVDGVSWSLFIFSFVLGLVLWVYMWRKMNRILYFQIKFCKC